MPTLLAGNFGWLTSFASPDPLFVFPLIVALASYLQQKLNITARSKAVGDINRVLKFMPILSFVFMISLPSGLVLYYAMSGILNLLSDYGLRNLN